MPRLPMPAEKIENKDPIFNIEHHVKKLVIGALNKFKSYRRAALELGITERTLYNYKKIWNIVREVDRTYYFKERGIIKTYRKPLDLMAG